MCVCLYVCPAFARGPCGCVVSAKCVVAIMSTGVDGRFEDDRSRDGRHKQTDPPPSTHTHSNCAFLPLFLPDEVGSA